MLVIQAKMPIYMQADMPILVQTRLMYNCQRTVSQKNCEQISITILSLKTLVSQCWLHCMSAHEIPNVLSLLKLTNFRSKILLVNLTCPICPFTAANMGEHMAGSFHTRRSDLTEPPAL